MYMHVDNYETMQEVFSMNSEQENVKKWHRVCIFLNDRDFNRLYKVVYKEKSIPSKIFRKALERYIEEALSDVESDGEPIIF